MVPAVLLYTQQLACILQQAAAAVPNTRVLDLKKYTLKLLLLQYRLSYITMYNIRRGQHGRVHWIDVILRTIRLIEHIQLGGCSRRPNLKIDLYI